MNLYRLSDRNNVHTIKRFSIYFVFCTLSLYNTTKATCSPLRRSCFTCLSHFSNFLSSQGVTFTCGAIIFGGFKTSDATAFSITEIEKRCFFEDGGTYQALGFSVSLVSSKLPLHLQAPYSNVYQTLQYLLCSSHVHHDCAWSISKNQRKTPDSIIASRNA